MESINNVDNTLIHISHLHPLKLLTSPEPKPICHACNTPCANQSYGCVHCHYFLHICCAKTGRYMDHPSHPGHTLMLELTPPYLHGYYECDGCGLTGTSFCLRCRECSYDLHLPCATIPHTVKHRSHRHPLILVHKNPYPPNAAAHCDVCKNYLDVNKWFYHCKKCDFSSHVGCVSRERLEVVSPGLQASHEPPPVQQTQPQPRGAAQVGNETNTLIQLQRQMMRAQTQNMSANMFANTMRNAGQDISSLFDNVHYVRRWI